MKLYRRLDYRRPMSKKVALLITRELWQWLAVNPDSTCKSDWPKWSKVNRIYGYMEASCPCCEFSIRENTRLLTRVTRCAFCPLLGYAWSITPGTYASYCQSHGSSYGKWCETVRWCSTHDDTPKKNVTTAETLVIRRTSALQIVEGCNKALKALELEKLMVNVSTVTREEV
jgi:hypothetical protein